MVTEQARETAAADVRDALASGRFVLTAELECPRDASAADVERQVRGYAAYVDAVNCGDNSAAMVRMSPVAAAALAARAGLAALVQLTCRDRNRIALQSDVLGAAAVGAVGIVCMTGDPPETGTHPNAKPVNDLNTLELIAAIRGMCAGRLISGDPLTTPPRLLIGAVENPAEGERSIGRLAAKIEAGAEFVQTQITFDVETFGRWLEWVRAAGLHQRVRILAGVAPLRRPSTARYLAQHVPGIVVPPAVLQRLEGADDPAEAGIDLAADLLRQIRDLPDVAGAHLISFGWVDGVRRLVDAL